MKGEQYLTSSAQYDRVYRQGRAWTSSLFVMRALPNNLEISRYGITVSKRIGNAVVRNRVKRLFREILRQSALRPGWDLVFSARVAANQADYHRMEKVIRDVISKAGVQSVTNEKLGSGND